MRNKYLFFLIFLIVSKLFFFSVNSAEQFNFDITEIEIFQNGDVIKGIKIAKINGILSVLPITKKKLFI